jgi:hypothetical protein
MASALWQVLLKVQSKPNNSALTCDECFTLLDYLMSAIISAADATGLRAALKTHWQYCSTCREHHLQMLQHMELELLEQNHAQNHQSLEGLLY